MMYMYHCLQLATAIRGEKWLDALNYNYNTTQCTVYQFTNNIHGYQFRDITTHAKR